MLQTELSLHPDNYRDGEESPDSTEHCTGEQPGISTDAEKYVEITDSATENNYPGIVGEKMKMWGKGPQLLMVTSLAGKPCKLKCHVYHRLRAARPMMEGRQIDPVEQLSGQINDSLETESGLRVCSFFLI